MNVLVISAHPDDETLGCGGTILKHTAAGDAVTWLIATQAYEPQWARAVVDAKAREVEAVTKAYGIQRTVKLGLPTVKLETLPQIEIMDKVRQVIADVRPETIYLVYGGDIHTDHTALFTAVMGVLKPFHLSKFGTRRILCYEIISSTDQAPPLPHRAFIPNAYSDISAQIDRKLEIMNLFASETQPDPLPRGPEAIRALARVRGATISVPYAEAFMVLREVF
jgi:LmbE family N-acetylglucosaminyl deacetylase